MRLHAVYDQLGSRCGAAGRNGDQPRKAHRIHEAAKEFDAVIFRGTVGIEQRLGEDQVLRNLAA